MQLSRRTFTTSALAPLFLPLVSGSPQVSAKLDVQMAVASDRIQRLGRFIPGGILDTELALVWVDPERQLFRLASGGSDEERQQAFMQSQFGAVPNLFINILRSEEFTGFSALNIMDAMAAFQAPFTLQLFRLNLDVEDLIPVWTDAGYVQKENEYGRYWTIGENGEVDLQNPVQQMALASLNNIAILDDHVIAYSAQATQLELIMATAKGDHPNVLAEIEPLTAALIDESISAMSVAGEYFSREGLVAPQPDLNARIEEFLGSSDEAVGPMPVVRSALAGTTEGSAMREDLLDQDAVAYLILQTEGDAELAAEVIAWRFENLMSLTSGQPYSEILGETEITTQSDDIVTITSKTGALTAVFNRMIMNADILPFAYRIS